jgi:hypothetical protein
MWLVEFFTKKNGFPSPEDPKKNANSFIDDVGTIHNRDKLKF